MATVRTELRTSADPDHVWAAFRDFGAVHERLAPGFVVATQLEPGARVVTFANGMIAREALITMDDARRRLVYAVTGNPRLTHHSAAFEVIPDGPGARVVWTADLLPDTAADTVGPMMEAGTAAMAKVLG